MATKLSLIMQVLIACADARARGACLSESSVDNVMIPTRSFISLLLPNLYTTLDELDYFCEVFQGISKNGLPKSA